MLTNTLCNQVLPGITGAKPHIPLPIYPASKPHRSLWVYLHPCSCVSTNRTNRSSPTVQTQGPLAQCNQLTDYLELIKLLGPSQSGFHASHSTESALTEVTDTIKLVLDKGTPAMLILLDLSAAFVTIFHQIPVQRLREFGIGGKVLKWFENFVSERTHVVQLDSFTSMIPFSP